MTRAVLFDLDGTLVDTLQDIAEAMNRVLADAGLELLPIEAYRDHVGWGARDLMRRALPAAEQARIEEHLAAFRVHYYAKPLGSSALYPGIGELLDELERRAVPMGILTNKPEEPALKVVGALMGEVPFREVRGAREGVPPKPDPTALLEVAEVVGAPPEGCLYLGDTEVDVQAARAAGMTPIGVRWGFRPDHLEGAAHLLTHPTDLLPLL